MYMVDLYVQTKEDRYLALETHIEKPRRSMSPNAFDL
jgi:hypothetical protein